MVPCFAVMFYEREKNERKNEDENNPLVRFGQRKHPEGPPHWSAYWTGSARPASWKPLRRNWQESH